MATVTPRRPPIFNLPNQLTAGRGVLGVVLFVLIAQENLWLWSIAVFALAAITDWLDGYFARKQGLVSTLGRNLDPLVDKVVVGGAYIFLLPVEGAGLEAWMVTLVVAREMIITGLRSFLENAGANFGADLLGKLKMILQCGALFAIFLAMEYRDWRLILARDIFIYLMLFATALSGVQYLYRAALLLKVED
jgi:CDP-diacylglycerol--glycerol-3-phosphate 3-phosphatidyltransferase